MYDAVALSFNPNDIVNSQQIIMIMALSSYNKESDYTDNIIDILNEIYKRSDCNLDIFLIIMEGNHCSGNSGQIKLDTN